MKVYVPNLYLLAHYGSAWTFTVVYSFYYYVQVTKYGHQYFCVIRANQNIACKLRIRIVITHVKLSAPPKSVGSLEK